MTYQLTLLINNKLDEKKRTDILDDVAKSIGDKSKKDLWGVRGLAYPIKHEERAYYAHFDFDVDPSMIPALDRKLKLNEEIVRYLLIKVDPKLAAKAAKPASASKAAAEKKEEKTEAKKAEKTDLNEEVEAEESTESTKEK